MRWILMFKQVPGSGCGGLLSTADLPFSGQRSLVFDNFLSFELPSG